jgi:UMF1 family MFS transporter
MKRAAKLKNTFLMLIAYFIYSDAYSTVSSVGILFGRRVVGLNNVKIVIVAIIVPFAALFGNFGKRVR